MLFYVILLIFRSARRLRYGMIFPKALRYWGALLKTMRVQKREIILDGRDFFHFRKKWP